jgi:hypothetical protein
VLIKLLESSISKTEGTNFDHRLEEKISQYYTMAKDTEVDKGKHSIIPPSPKKIFLDRTSNRVSGQLPRSGLAIGCVHAT